MHNYRNYYKLLHEEDSKDQGKFCVVPKLTNNQIQPINTMKMRVSFATQYNFIYKLFYNNYILLL